MCGGVPVYDDMHMAHMGMWVRGQTSLPDIIFHLIWEMSSFLLLLFNASYVALEFSRILLGLPPTSLVVLQPHVPITVQNINGVLGTHT